MELAPQSTEKTRPCLNSQRIIDWAHAHYRIRTFSKDEPIPVRVGLLYWVQKGAVRLMGKTALNSDIQTINNPLAMEEESFLGFVGAGLPFEIVPHKPINIQVYAHVEQTSIIWMYWYELDNWGHFHRQVLEAFRYQHQRKLLWLSILGQKKTIDRLYGFLNLLIEEYGEKTEAGYCLPYPITQAQIGTAIGATRVTVTRLMGRLKKQGLISIKDGRFICLSLVINNE